MVKVIAFFLSIFVFDMMCYLGDRCREDQKKTLAVAAWLQALVVLLIGFA